MRNFDEEQLLAIYRSFNPLRAKRFRFSSEENWQTYTKLEWSMSKQLLLLFIITIFCLYLTNQILILLFVRLFRNAGLLNIFSALSIPVFVFLLYYANKILFVRRFLKKEFTKSFFEDIFYQI